jgi:tol-pal system protein YbgF
MIPPPAPAPVPVPVPQTAQNAPDPAVTTDVQAERQAYERAFDTIKAGRYEEAVDEFRSFLSRYPGSTYSANAQYWLGEANYVMRRFEEAAVEFDKVLKFYPDSAKAADAMLKLGFSQYELQRWSDASATLQRVIERYPSSTARQLAEGRLQRMRMEGR